MYSEDVNLRKRELIMSYLEKLQYSFDWLNGTLPFYDVRYFFDCLEKIHPDLAFSEFHDRNRGIYNYSTSFGLLGDSRFIVAFNPDYDNYDSNYGNDFGYYPMHAVNGGFNPGIFVSISGDGLRYLNSLGEDIVYKLFAFFKKNGFKASRLDVACDIYDKENPVVPLLIEAFYYAVKRVAGAPTLVSNIRRTPNNINIYVTPDPYRNDNDFSQGISFGNHGSSWGMFRMYDKWLEVKIGRLSKYADELLEGKDYWYRLEYELHKEHAQELFNLFDQLSVAQCFGYAADDMFNVVIPKTENTRSNECSISVVWTEFLEYVSSNIHFVQLVNTPYIEKSVNNTKNWVLSLSKAFFAVFELFDADPAFKDEALRRGYSKYCDDLKYAPFRRELEQIKSERGA